MKPVFSEIIIDWYHKHKRDLPWRGTKDPYKIWISEIILQQTRVSQGLPYYEKFIQDFPTILDFARADEQNILKHWQGLGYYSRARNMHFTAKVIVDVMHGIFPNSYAKLLNLKGVGEYTAAAIASFSYGEIVPTIDGNVYRVLSRYFGIEIPIDSSIAKMEFKKLSNELIDKNKPDIYNQAVMEFGALQCVPTLPNCGICPLNNSCFALKNDKVRILPIKKKKTIPKKRYFNYLILLDKQHHCIVQKRESNDIWKHLYEFPLIESSFNETELLNILKYCERYSDNILNISLLNNIPIKHKLTHQEIDISFWKIEVLTLNTDNIKLDQILNLPFPIIIHKFLINFIKDY